jgi:alpha-L-rhamnosidase
MKIYKLALTLLFLCSFVSLFGQGKLQNLLTEYQSNPLGLDVEKPRFSWQITNLPKQFGQKQKAYQIIVTNEANQTVWDSQKIASDVSLGIEYAGQALKPTTKYTWTLKVWNATDQELSAKASFETGLMNADAHLAAWNGGKWIGTNKIPFYAHYQSVYVLKYDLQIKKGSKASFIFGGNDPRLMNKNLNIQGVENAKNQSYIALEIDLENLQTSDTAKANFKIYRAGYDQKDNPSKPFKSFQIAQSILNKSNQSLKHTVYAICNFGLFDFYLDAIDASHKINPSPAGGSPFASRGLNLNPVGAGNNFISFPMVSEIGFLLEPGNEAVFSQIMIKNFRKPSNEIFNSDRNLQLFADKNCIIQGNDLLVSASNDKTIILKDPSQFAAPMLRTQFSIPSKLIKKARIYATARGIYELYLNGKRVGKDYFNPGLTQYNINHQYQSFDVTNLVHSGKNAWGAWLGEGWWSGNITYSGENWNFFGDRQSLLAKLVITYSDGSEQVITTEPSLWKTFSDGPIRTGSFFQGEVYDAQKEKTIANWSSAYYKDAAWEPSVEIPLNNTTAFVGESADFSGRKSSLDYSNLKLSGQLDDKVTIVKSIKAKALSEPRKGVFVYDMGQNTVGIPKIQIKGGKVGQVITLRFAEVLYPNLPEHKGLEGMIMLENIRAALAQDVYVLKGGDEIIQPRFTFHGYRFLEITGIDVALPLESVHTQVLSSVANLTSDYKTSDTLVNKLWENINWSFRSNFLSIPTDTPARNERMGWSGDINVFSKAATYLAPINNFMRKHLLAMRDMQSKEGRFTDVAPVGGGFGGTLWGSAGIVVAWETYQQFGDLAMLKEHYPAMKKYIAFLESKVNAEGILNEGPLGDWLSPEGNKNDNTLFWVAYQAYNLEIMSKVARILGINADALEYEMTYEKKKRLFNEVYVSNEGKTIKSGVKTARMGPPSARPANEPDKSDKGQLIDTQGSYAVPLNLGVVSEDKKAKFLNNYVETVTRVSVDDAGEKRPPYSLMTGFIGTASVSEALSKNGKDDLAYEILTNKSYPSWLYSVVNGATSIWERLNSYTIENGFGGNNSMNSFNHYSFGAVAAWMYNYSLGIQRDPKSPGFKHFVLNPRIDPTGKIKFAKGHVQTMYGDIKSSWRKTGNAISYQFTVPANTSAKLILQARNLQAIRNLGKPLKVGNGVVSITEKGTNVEVELESGTYGFSVFN